MTTDFIMSECHHIAANFQKLAALSSEIAGAAEICTDAISHGHKILFCGNGGSAADAQHLAAELVGRYEIDRPAMNAIALTTDTSILTAIGNDYGYKEIFARQIAGIGHPGDVLYAISTSGNSENVLKAIAAARRIGMKVIAVTGSSGGKMRDCCDVLLNVPANTANHIQEMHIAIGHMICGLCENSIVGNSQPAH